MAAKALDAAAVGLPSFDVPPVDEAAAPADPFALSSHQRARRALEFGLGIEEPGFNIFVLGESRSGRMTATLDYLTKWIADIRSLPAGQSWFQYGKATPKYLMGYRVNSEPSMKASGSVADAVTRMPADPRTTMASPTARVRRVVQRSAARDARKPKVMKPKEFSAKA